MESYQVAFKSRVSEMPGHLISSIFMGRKYMACPSTILSAKMWLKKWLEIILKMVLASEAQVLVSVPGAVLLSH